MKSKKKNFPSKITAFITVGLSIILGGGSMLALTWFMYFGEFLPIRFELSEPAVLGFDSLLCLAFFIQHSGMVRKSFRRRLGEYVHEAFNSAIFSIVSGAVLFTLVICWQKSTFMVFEFQGAPRYILRFFFFASIAGSFWGFWALRYFDSLGITPLLIREGKKEKQPAEFVVRGPYRFIRHPLYFFSLMMIWSFPDLTADRLVFNILWTVWIFIGTMLEERDLVAAQGNAYKDYQKQVPMLIPFIKT